MIGQPPTPGTPRWLLQPVGVWEHVQHKPHIAHTQAQLLAADGRQVKPSGCTWMQDEALYNKDAGEKHEAHQDTPHSNMRCW
jgi:hypothetical protein